MLTLALLRHAKSSWDNPGQDDFERPLNERGIKAAPYAGKALAETGIQPGIVLCSSAARTRETLALAEPAMKFTRTPKIVVEDKLYLATPLELLEALHDIPDKQQCALVIGHNPGLHDLAVNLAAYGGAQALESLSVRFPTAAFVVLRIDRPRWSEVRPGDGELQVFWTPKKGAA